MSDYQTRVKNAWKAAYGSSSFSTETITDLLGLLKGIRKRVKDGNPPQTRGIGVALNAAIDSLNLDGNSGLALESAAEKLGTTVCTHWPEFSGNLGYPVPGPCRMPDYVGAYYAYDDPSRWYWNHPSDGSAWTGLYGAARMRLLDFYIGVLSEGLGVCDTDSE